MTSSRALILMPLLAAIASGCTAGVAPTGTASIVTTAVPAPLDKVFLVSDSWATRAGSTFELFSAGGLVPSRLTFCEGCQALSASPSRDRNRVALRRVTTDTNRDGRMDEFDRTTLLLVDLQRRLEGPFLPDGWSTSSADWSSDGTFILHTSSPDGRTDGLYTVDANTQNNQNIIYDPNVRVRGARLNNSITRAVYERIASASVGKSEIWTGVSNANQFKVTDGGVVGAQLPNSLYLVGSDASPDYSPDGLNIVFRRLTSTAGTNGTWDIMIVPSTGGTPRVLVSGALYRSEPDWSGEGIVFSEANPTTGGMDIVVINPETNERRVLQAFGGGFRATAPRWIAGISG
jgi:hypothetical protein